MIFNSKKMDQIVRNATSKKHIYGAVFHISSGDNKKYWYGASGNLNVDSSYYIASINKLVISSIVLKLISDGFLNFEDTLSKFLPEDLIKGIHIFDDKDYSNDITILQMLSNTSGLPCYLSDKPNTRVSGIKELEAGIDKPWPTDKVIETIKEMKPHFPPGTTNKAKYVDTNHQLLNLVIQNITNKSVKTVLNQLFSELGMLNTYVSENPNDMSYIYPYYKDEQRNISQYITSTNNDIISTAYDQMIFIKSFFNGEFYPKDQLKDLEKWNSIFFPFKYGIGIQKFYMPRLLSPFKAVPGMIGHCGSTGSVAFYVPEKDIYITGTTNQQARPNIAFQTIIKIIHSLE